MNLKEMEKVAGVASELMKALASEKRLMILCRLAEGEKPVGALAKLLQMRQAALSQHLALLRKDGLVAARRDGQTVYYSLASPAARKIIAVLYDLYCAPQEEAKRKRRPELAL